MSSSRKYRRRRERSRANRPAVQRRLSASRRLLLVALGVVLVVAGILLLIRGGPGTAVRLGRVAGILIIIGLVLMGVAAVGKM